MYPRAVRWSTSKGGFQLTTVTMKSPVPVSRGVAQNQRHLRRQV